LDTERALDDVGWRLLYELQENARLSYTELGRRLGLTAPAVAERVRRLEDSGVVTGYHAHVDLAKVGLPITAHVRIRCHAGYTCAQVAELSREFPEVLESSRVTGEDSCVLKIAARSVEHLQTFIDQMLMYGETTTSIVLSAPVTRRVIVPAHVQEEAAAA
jgi:Lrp/AsnC family transcriptional regulator, leucine-responsive regulatory protein